MVENQLDNKTLEINDCNFKQTVYVYNCKNVVLQINSKVNSICIDKCTRTAVVFTDVVAACEIVNGSSIEVQVKGVVPTVAVDNCSGVQIYISRASLGAPGPPPRCDWIANHAAPRLPRHLCGDGRLRPCI